MPCDMVRFFSPSFAALIWLVSITGCHHAEPKLTDAGLQAIRDANPGMTEECLESIKFGGIVAIPGRVDQCYEMAPPQRWRGQWHDGFEGQIFCPESDRACAAGDQDQLNWLTFATGARPTSATSTGKSYAIDFIGRRTRYPGNYGHFGVFRNAIVVDKLISISATDEG